MKYSLELLAPAGTSEVFAAAVENGADAVYIGAPAANARALARPFSLEEIAAMTAFAHGHGVKIYVAMNSLLKDSELSSVITLLSVFSSIGIDAVIIQDLGLFKLARRYFPELRLHASTLMGAHNSAAVKLFSDMGFSRVVLAREMRIDEIAAAVKASRAEVEVFVHGAMCFAYSGLCMFSSYLGGKSGLRGRCVQPCRRRYSWAGGTKDKSGYFFSMNDLSGLQLVDQLQEAGVRSLKIEGRMRSRNYVANVVRAYRLVLDNGLKDQLAVKEANLLLDAAMGRKTTSGYFLNQADEKLISHRFSGNIGLFIGKIDRYRQGMIEVKLREALQVGDRLRVHFEKSGERLAFTVKNIWQGSEEVGNGRAGDSVGIDMPKDASAGDSLYKVDSNAGKATGGQSKISPKKFKEVIRKVKARPEINRIISAVCKPSSHPAPIIRATKQRKHNVRRRYEDKTIKIKTLKHMDLPIPCWLKIDDLNVLRQLPEHVGYAHIVVVLSRESIRQFKRISMPGWQRKRLIWALPPVILEAELKFYQQSVLSLAQSGFSNWQIGHIGQLQIFKMITEKLIGRAEKITASHKNRSRPPKGRKRSRSRISAFKLHGNYTLNVLNYLALEAGGEGGLSSCQIAIEADKDIVHNIGARARCNVGMTVYAYPALFTARPEPGFFSYEKTLVSPKGERFVLKRRCNSTIAAPIQPFSLLNRLDEIKSFGVNYVVIDLSLSQSRRGELEQISRRLAGKHTKKERLSSFNYNGTLL